MRWLLVVALSASSVGCFDEPEGSMSGTTAAEDTSTGPTVSITGTVQGSLFDDQSPVGGTTVTVIGSDAVATTDPDGNFTLEGVPADATAWVAVAPSETYLGAVAGVEVAFVDIADVRLSLYARDDFGQLLTMLNAMDPAVTYDTSLGGIAVIASAQMTTIALDPMPPAGNYFAFDGAGMATLNSQVSDFILPIVGFFNLAPAEPGTGPTVSATHPTLGCEVPLGEPPVLADHLTAIIAVCM